MNSRKKRSPMPRVLRWLACAAAVLALPCMADEPEAPKGDTDPRAMAVQFTDDSVLRLRLTDQPLEIQTKHGRLVVPTDQIKRIAFASRVDAQTQAQIDRAVAELADPDASVAEAAADRLFGFRALAYHPVKRAAASDNRRVVKRASQLLERLEAKYAQYIATLRDTDLIETEEEKIVGRLTATTIPIETRQFGKLTMKLADAHSMRSLSLIAEEPEPEQGEVLPDPGNLKAYEAMVNKTFRFEVTGKTGSCWGSDVYTTDSILGAVAVHAGVLAIGETGIVEVKIVSPPASFGSSSRNGISTRPWGQYPGAYEIVKPKKNPRRE